MGWRGGIPWRQQEKCELKSLPPSEGRGAFALGEGLQKNPSVTVKYSRGYRHLKYSHGSQTDPAGLCSLTGLTTLLMKLSPLSGGFMRKSGHVDTHTHTPSSYSIAESQTHNIP